MVLLEIFLLSSLVFLLVAQRLAQRLVAFFRVGSVLSAQSPEGFDTLDQVWTFLDEDVIQCIYLGGSCWW